MSTLRMMTCHAGDESKIKLQQDGHTFWPDEVPYRSFRELSSSQLRKLFEALMAELVLQPEAVKEAVDANDDLPTPSRVRVMAAVYTKLRQMPRRPQGAQEDGQQRTQAGAPAANGVVQRKMCIVLLLLQFLCVSP